MKIIQVKVKPNAKQQSLQLEADGSFTARLHSPPLDGKANAELIQLVAKHFGVAKGAIRIKAGETERRKLLEIDED